MYQDSYRNIYKERLKFDSFNEQENSDDQMEFVNSSQGQTSQDKNLATDDIFIPERNSSVFICMLARKFNLSYRYTDDLISFNNKRFKEFISDIYPKELTISETTESTSIASYLDLLFIRDKSNNITTKLYDTRDAFGFHIVNFPFMSSNIFHQHQPVVSMHLSSFAMPVIAPIMVTFHYATGR